MRYTWNGKECYIDGYLATQLDTMVYNISNDWDFLIIISGDRMVRVGKSVLGQQVAGYLAYRTSIYKKTPISFGIDDIYFDSESMTTAAQKKPKYHVNVYDEARESLAATKHTQKVSQDVVDFFNECGQLNQIFVLILPDFFSLKEEIAVGRSECLLNVYRRDIKIMRDMYKEGNQIPLVRFDRGFLEFFSRYKKSDLFDNFRKTRRKNYHSTKANFIGRFMNTYVVDEEEYRKKKAEALERFKERQNKKVEDKYIKIRDYNFAKYHKEGLTGQEMSDRWRGVSTEEFTPQYCLKLARTAANKGGVEV